MPVSTSKTHDSQHEFGPGIEKAFEVGTTSYIAKPLRYKNFLIWPNTVINEMDYIDCAQTSKGYCIKGKTLEECVDITSVDGTGLGTLIAYPDGRTVCMPVNTRVYPHVNPVNNLRIQAIYPELKHTTAYTFIDTNKFPYPDYDCNAIYAYDIVELVSVDTGYKLISSPAAEGELQYDLWFESGGTPLKLQLASFNSPEYEPYDKIAHGEKITLYVPGTSMSLIGTVNETLVAKNVTNEMIPFEIVALDPKNKEYPSYDDTFALKYGNNFVVLEENLHFLYFVNVDLEYLLAAETNGDIKSTSTNSSFFFRFKLVPQVNAYYCKKNVCYRTELNKTKMDGTKATYDGAQVSRQTDCWQKCDITADLLLWLYQDYVPDQKSISDSPASSLAEKTVEKGSGGVSNTDTVNVVTGASYNGGGYRNTIIVLGAIVGVIVLGALIYSRTVSQASGKRSRPH